jgi:hypothetical protein
MSIYLNNIISQKKKKKGASKNLGSLFKKRKYLFINLKETKKIIDKKKERVSKNLYKKK